MNRRNLFRSTIGAAMLAVAARLGFDAKVEPEPYTDWEMWLTPDDEYAYSIGADFDTEMYRIRVLGEYTLPNQPWRVVTVAKSRVEIERDYP